MEDDFLDLGFVDQSLLEGIPEAESTKPEKDKGSQEPQQNPEENIETVNKANVEEEVVENPNDTNDPGSPNTSSSIAKALVEEGVLQTLDDERISKISNAEDLIDAFREELNNQLDETQKRINNALTYGVEPSRIQQYEHTISTLDSITDEVLEGESEAHENYRKNLIFQHYKSKGFNDEDAQEMVERSLESGKDIDDAKKAVTALRDYYKQAYNYEVSNAKKEHENRVAYQKKQLQDLKDSIIEDKENFYDQFELSKSSRQKIYDVVAKPSIVDGDVKVTPLQKFIKDDPNRANKIIGTLYVLTDGFTKFDNIMKGAVKKQVRKSVEELDRVLSRTKVNDGSFNFKAGISNDLSNVKIVDFDFDEL